MHSSPENKDILCLNDKVISMNNNTIIQYLGKIYFPKEESVQEREWKPIISYLKDEKKAREISVLCKKHKIMEVVLTNIQKASSWSNSALSLLEEKLTQIKNQHYTTVSPDERERSLKVIDSKDCLIIKGSVLFQIYPEEYTRFQSDIDIMARNLPQFWNTLVSSQSQYTYNRIKLYFQDPSHYSASVDLKPKDRKNYRYIDLHLQPFYIWGGVHLRLDLFKRAKRADGFLIPSIEDQIIMIIAHMAYQWTYRMRDINDFFLLSQSLMIDWKYIENKIKENSLSDLLSVFIYLTKSIYKEKFNCPLDVHDLSLQSKLFMYHCFGIGNSWASILIQYFFTHQNYTKLKYKNPFVEAVKNSIYLVVFHERAFKVNRKVQIKKPKKNEIIVISPLSSHKNQENEIIPTINVIDTSPQYELLETPIGLFKQISYYGELGKNQHKRTKQRGQG